MPRMKRWTAFLLAMIMLWSAAPAEVLAETVSELLDTRSFVDAMLAESGGYTVTFDYGDGGIRPSVVIPNVEYNTRRDDLMEKHKIPQTPEREGYDFRGWAPSDVSYIQADTVYTAVWSTKNKYTLTVYYLYDGDNKVAAPTVIYTYPMGAQYEIESPKVVGYYTETELVSGQAGDDSWKGQTAKQERVYYLPSGSTAYQIRYLLEKTDSEDGYDTALIETKEATTGTYAEVTDPPAYEGFSLRPNQQLRAKVAPDGSTVIDVYYERNTYNLSFDSRGGTYVEPEGHRYGEALAAPQAPTRTGYAFKGWYDAATGQPYVFGAMPAGDVNLYAEWAAGQASYTIVYWTQDADNLTKYNYESSVVVTGATVGSTVTATGAPVKTVNGIPITRFSRSDSAVVQGDGSTVLNVYSDLIVFTYTFELSRFYSRPYYYYHEMVFEGTTYRDDLRKYSLQARYGESLTGKWPSTVNAVFTHGYYTNYSFTGWKPNFGNTVWVTQRWNITADMLPSTGTSVTLTAQWANAGLKTVNYWLEKLPNETGGTPVGGTEYVRSEAYSQTYYSTSTGLNPKDIDGMVFATGAQATNVFNFYYKRVRSTLSFNTQGGPDQPADRAGIMYGELLEDYEPLDYIGTTYEKDGVTYTFDGWYYQAENGQAVDFAADTMPAGNLEVFAKWKAPVHTVTFYRQQGDTEPYAVIEVPHGKSVQAVMETDPNITLSQPSNPGYDFVTWRFDGVTGAAYTTGMSVQQDLAVYAQWRLNNSVSYRVEYLEEGSLKPIRDSELRTGYYVGQTVTEESPSVPGYLVDRPIKTLKLEPSGNVIQFKYKTSDPFGYRIVGIRSDTGEEIYAEDVPGQQDAYYVTVTAPEIPGYVPMPPATLSRQLSYDSEQNVFVFRYLPSDLYAEYTIRYYLEDPDNFSGGTYVQLQERVKGGQVGLLAQAEEKQFPGYKLDPVRSVQSGVIVSNEGGAGLVLQMYYSLQRGDVTVEKVWDDAADTTRRGKVMVELTNSAFTQSGNEFRKVIELDESNNYRETLYGLHVNETEINGETVTVSPAVFTVKETSLKGEPVGGIGSRVGYYTYVSADSKKWDGEAKPFTLQVKNSLSQADYVIHHYLRGTDIKVAEDQVGVAAIGERLPLIAATRDGAPRLLEAYQTAVPADGNPAVMEIKAGSGNEVILYYRVLTTVTAQKIWKNGPVADHTAVSLKLLRRTDEGEAELVGATDVASGTNESGSWVYTWPGLDKLDGAGREYTYFVKEEAESGGEILQNGNHYQVSYGKDGLTLTNEYIVPTQGFSATKKWVQGPETDHTGVTLDLYRSLAGGEPVKVEGVGKAGEQTKEPGVFAYEWTGLPMTDERGLSYVYSVREPGAEDGQVTVNGRLYAVTQSGSEITNTYRIPLDGRFTAAKVWSGDKTVDRPEMLFTLHRRIPGQADSDSLVPGAPVKTVTATETKAAWDQLARTDAMGREYEFYVTEAFAAESPLNANLQLGQWDAQTSSITNSVIPGSGKLTVSKAPISFGLQAGAMAGAAGATEGTIEGAAGETVRFAFEVTGPYGYQERFTLAPGESKMLSGLYFGEYTVTETGTQGYEPSYAPGQQVSLTALSPSASVRVTNTNTGSNEALLVTPTVRKVWVGGTKPDTVIELWRRGLNAQGAQTDERVDSHTFTSTDTIHIFKGSGLYRHDPTGRAYQYYVKEPTVPANYAAAFSQEDGTLVVTNTYTSPVKKLTLSKEWTGLALNDAVPATYLQLERRAAGDAQAKPLGSPYPVEGGAAGADGRLLREITTDDLPTHDPNGLPYTYSVRETDAQGNDYTPDGYQKTENGLRVVNAYDGLSQNNIKTPVTLKVQKSWKNVPQGAALPAALSFDLYRGLNGAEEEEPVLTKSFSVASADTATWTMSTADSADILRFAPDGSAYTYRVSERPVNGYTTAYDPAAQAVTESDPLVITNSYDGTNGGTDYAGFTATKRWEKIPEGQKGAASVLRLKRNGAAMTEEAYSVSLQDDGSHIATHTWSELPKYAPDSSLYVYSVEEPTVPSGYQASVSENGDIVTNSYTGLGPNGETATALLTKKWVIPGGVPEGTSVPTVTLALLQNDQSMGGEYEYSLAYDPDLADTGVSKLVSGLPLYDPSGKKFVYTAKELDVPAGYAMSRSADGLTVLNTYDGTTDPETPGQPKLVTVQVNKTWKSSAGLREGAPLTATFTVLQDGKPFTLPEGQQASVTISGAPSADADEWTVENAALWSGLPYYRADGKAFVYSVSESNVTPGYKETVAAAAGNMHVIVNAYTPETYDIKITKRWESELGMSALIGHSLPAATAQLQRREKGGQDWTNLPGYEHKFGNEVVPESANEYFEQSHTFSGLPRTAPSGAEYEYRAMETVPPKGYLPSTGDAFTLINRYDGLTDHDPDTQDAMRPMRAVKRWEGLRDGDLRPAVTLSLYRDDLDAPLGSLLIPSRPENGGDDSVSFDSANLPADKWLRFDPEGKPLHLSH